MAGVIGRWKHMHCLPIPQRATEDAPKGQEHLVISSLGDAHLADSPRDRTGRYGYHLRYVDRTGASGVGAAGLDGCCAGLDALQPCSDPIDWLVHSLGIAQAGMTGMIALNSTV